MKTRIVLTIVLVAAIVAINIALYQAALPNTASNLAVGQMNEDGSREALRSLQQIQAGLGSWLYVICAVVLFLYLVEADEEFFEKAIHIPRFGFLPGCLIILNWLSKTIRR